MVSVSNGQVSVSVLVSDDEVSVLVSVSDDEAETPSQQVAQDANLLSKCVPLMDWKSKMATVTCKESMKKKRLNQILT